MRENRTYGSEGGEAKAFPTPIEAQLPRLNDCVRAKETRHAYAAANASGANDLCAPSRLSP
jgi:hypothetical protein